MLEWLEERRQAAAESGCSPEDAELRFLSLAYISIYIDDGTAASIDDLPKASCPRVPELPPLSLSHCALLRRGDPVS